MKTTMNCPRTVMLVAAAAMLAFVLLATTPAAMAQVPPHAPGSLCVTPQGWCWAQVRGPVGGPCACPTPSGWVRGALG
jgi:hypothetical protein